MSDPVVRPGPGMRVAPGGATDARPTPGAALTNAILGPQLAGVPGQPERQAALQGLFKALGLPENTQITDRNADQIQARLLQHLSQLGVDVGQPPSLEKAREAMISALQNQPGMSREELSNTSLTDLMARFRGMREQQARPQDGVEPGGRRAPPGGAEPAAPGDPRRGGPPRPRQQQGVRPGQREQRPAPARRHPAPQPQRRVAAQPRAPQHVERAARAPETREAPPVTPQQIGARINEFWRTEMPAGGHTRETAAQVWDALRRYPQALRFVAPEVMAELNRLTPSRPAERPGGE